jgi:hypothetical protein
MLQFLKPMGILKYKINERYAFLDMVPIPKTR